MNEKRTLHLNLKGLYFHQIKLLEKDREYRVMTDRWKKIIEEKEYDEIKIKLGYPRADQEDRIITRPWKGYEVIKGFIHPHFGTEPVDVFAIIVN